jgi:hypothetical protein
MAKRKLPPEKKVWARIVNQGWEIYLTSGETLRPIEPIDRGHAERLARTLSVYRISFLSPVVQLTGEEKQIAVELALVDDSGQSDFDTNSAWIFAADAQTRAVVFEYHH